MVDSQNISFLLKSPYSIIICILCSVAMNCIIHDHGYNVQLAALYVPPFYTTTLGWYDWANEATFKHALEICVNLITEVLTLFSLIPWL